ncbi:conserved hypothetical protein [Neospora caninum Liverpool]|uniref:Translation initiation factor IF-2 n=1 Tax=Neospora caninum (strain Liverpool) TaxID=572307 RepID=F0VHP3_NEOCL|nr:conserved hypothetical protein [Neospora caninum Liverpool]CBZ53254.1 conserved hypothetical protein [Neospora caninum Liverpool]CEL67240.1 TPA: Translation initiation factor IF-2 [Neospora caninum Liverpool]|eukprot:XP_003883286.1 conserved hypothetical protein [Neospora caninum Liverpool]
MRKQERPKNLRRDASGDEEDKDVFDDDDASAGSLSSDEDAQTGLEGGRESRAPQGSTVSPKGCPRDVNELPTAEDEVDADTRGRNEDDGEAFARTCGPNGEERRAEPFQGRGNRRATPTWQLIKEDPSFVPRGGSYFLHDDRGEASGEEPATDEEQPSRKGETRAFADVPSDDENFYSDDVPRSTQTRIGRPRKLWTADEAGQGEGRDGKWVHDRFETLLEGNDQPRPFRPIRGFYGPRPRIFRRTPPSGYAPGPRGGRRRAPAPRSAGSGHSGPHSAQPFGGAGRGGPRRSRETRFGRGADMRAVETPFPGEERGGRERGGRRKETDKRENEAYAVATPGKLVLASGAEGYNERPGQQGGVSTARGRGRGRRREGRAAGITTAYVVKGEQHGTTRASTGDSEHSQDRTPENNRDSSNVTDRTPRRPRGRRGGFRSRTGARTEWAVREQKPVPVETAAPVSA